MNDDPLNKKNTSCLKGIFAIVILIHHLFQYGKFTYNYYLQNMGEWSVAFFFFVSGYGLISSYINKGEKYINDFPKKRILPFYLTYLLFVIIYILANITIGEQITIEQIIRSLFFGGTIVRLGWFLQTILLFYIFFYLIFKIFKTEDARKIFLFIAWVCYYILCKKMQLSVTWYASSIAFLIGIFTKFQELKNEKSVMNSHWVLNFTVSFLSFIITVVIEKNNYLKGTNELILLNFIQNSSFVMSIMYLVKIIYYEKIKKILYNRFTEYLGKISFEIYAVQGIFLVIYKKIISSKLLYVIAVSISTILLATVIRYAVKKIYKLCKGEENGEIKINDYNWNKTRNY